MKKLVDLLRYPPTEMRIWVLGTSTSLDPLSRQREIDRILSDEEALWADWLAVGHDMREAMKRADAEPTKGSGTAPSDKVRIAG